MMDVSEADHLARDFAQYSRRREYRETQTTVWSSAVLWGASAVVAAAFLAGVAIAFS
jgi:anti-sigma-K factor RskA